MRMEIIERLEKLCSDNKGIFSIINNKNGIRALTTKERSMIQTFPENFKFLGSKTNQEQMIGNAVPVNLGKYIGEAILKYIERKDNNVCFYNKQKIIGKESFIPFVGENKV